MRPFAAASGTEGRVPPPSLYSARIGLFSTICLGTGMGIAIGMVAGTSGLKGSARGRMTILAAIIGLVIGYLAASMFDGSLPVGALFGALFAGLACVIVSDVKLGASRRSGGAGGSALGALIVAGAIVVALLTLLFEPLALVFAAGLIWLAVARSRKGDRKHAGLRVLR